MFAKSCPSILVGTLLAAAWLSTIAAERSQDRVGRTDGEQALVDLAEQRVGVADMSCPERTHWLDGVDGDSGAGLADNDVRVTTSLAAPDAGSTVNLYWPAGEGPYLVLVYFREAGSGSGDAEQARAARVLAKSADAVVVSVGLTAGGTGDDSPASAQAQAQAYQAYRWALANASGLGGDPQRVAVLGVGMAGPVAVAVAVAARTLHGAPPPAQASASPRFLDIAWPAGDARSARSTNKTYRTM